MNRFNYRNLKIKSTIVLLFFVCSVFAQPNVVEKKATIEIKGLVRDAHTKKPLNAVQVSAINSKTSTVTDENGNFSINVSLNTDILKVVAYDYNLTEYPLRGQGMITIDLHSNQFTNYFRNIDGITGKINASFATNGLKSIQINERQTALAADEMMVELGGDVRSIGRSGILGEGASLFIRGMNSLNANAQPLFVVDGVIWNNFYDVTSIHNGFFVNTLDNIDVSDIESMTVIKDGTSVYGSKAANGVVLINTKRGKSMVTKINLNIFAGIKSKPSNIPMMSGEQFRTYASEMLLSKGVTPAEIGNYGFLETNPNNKQIYNTFHNNTDWTDEVYQQGFSQNYNINVRGGDEKALYYFSLGYSGNKDVIKTIDFTRINSRFNADLNLAHNLTMGLNIAYAQTERTNSDFGITPFSVGWLSKIKSPFLNPRGYTYEGALSADYANADSLNIANPSAILKFYDVNGMKNYRFNIGFMPSLKITPEITLSTMFDYSLVKGSERRYIPLGYTPAIYLPEYDSYSYNEVNSQTMRNNAVYDDTRLTYGKIFGNLHNLKAMLGWRYLNNLYESSYAEGHNTGVNTNTTISGSLKFLKNDGIDNTTKSLSNYINAEYNYSNRYFATAAVSVDGSSRFGKETAGGLNIFGHSFAVFPSLSAGWLISSERFMKNVNFINFLKLRAGYGLTGNDGIKDYQSEAYFASVRFMERASGLILSNLENPKIQWETTSKLNAGLDMNLFNNILSASFDLFSDKTSNLLMLRDLPDVSGLGKYWDNGGAMANKGFEASFNVKALNLKNIKWELGFSIGHYKNEITSLPFGAYTTEVYGGQILTAVGESAGAFYGYKTKGVFSTQAQADIAGLKIKNTDGSYTGFGAGDIQFEERMVDGIIDENDKQVIGNPNPDFYGNIYTKLFVQKFTLSAMFGYSYGNDVYNYQRRLLESGSELYNQSTAMLRRWTAEGQITDQPKLYYGDPMGNSRFSDRWIEDGSYLKLKSVTLSYDFPIKSDFIEGFTVWGSANNLFTLTKYLGLDPEVSAQNSVYYQGIDAGLLPTTKSYYIGINFKL